MNATTGTMQMLITPNALTCILTLEKPPAISCPLPSPYTSVSSTLYSAMSAVVKIKGPASWQCRSILAPMPCQ
eukprot:2532820-Prymnesium_polylepis.3